MKAIFTSARSGIIVLSILFSFFSSGLGAQTSFQVTVSSSKFDPAELTVHTGDTVVWKNIAGSHNVDGQKSVFPSNPVSFGNSVSTGWTYKFVFNTAGTYDYHCDVHASFGMVGKVIVNSGTSTSNRVIATSGEIIVLYPNPATENIELKVPVNYGAIQSLKVYSISGSMVGEKAYAGNFSSLIYNVSRLRTGVYFIEIKSESRRDVLKFTKQ